MSDKEYRKYLISCGFDEKEVEQKIKERDIMRELYYKGNNKEPREITSAAYERSRKRMTKEVERFIGVKNA